ncbi:hypothetical protein BZG36_04016 [Bifiguratus adelaidae]|uniref:Uncharacterized protein n=1 Tax=Bifiguratus adelaidae TaxID=1938954 RepID=A0A261XYX0_9FUNG|nr:hypothetical protein BZG36_04016 [Bifiguratus adelaidae]
MSTFETYDFDKDQRFLKGLPTLLNGLLESVKRNGEAIDKETYEKEVLRAKAYYYDRFVSSFDIQGYMTQKENEKKASASACPYAHLWQNKGSGSSDVMGTQAGDLKQQIRVQSAPSGQGALHVIFSSPKTDSCFTIRNIAQVYHCVHRAREDADVTSLFLSGTYKAPKADMPVPTSEIRTVDTHIFSQGVPILETVDYALSQSTSSDASASSPVDICNKHVDRLLDTYFHLIHKLDMFRKDKPTVVFLDGAVPLSMVEFVDTTTIRVATERALFNPSMLSAESMVNPVIGLTALVALEKRARSARSSSPRKSFAQGMALYLAFQEPSFILRGPDLLRLGFIDTFIPSSNLKDTIKTTWTNSACPNPGTEDAIRLYLETERAYAGPAKIDVWQQEIEECFGDAVSAADVLERLVKMDNKWTNALRSHLEAQDPLRLEIIYQALKKAQDLSFEECLVLQDTIGKNWRRENAEGSKYGAWLEGLVNGEYSVRDQGKAQGNTEITDETDVIDLARRFLAPLGDDEAKLSLQESDAHMGLQVDGYEPQEQADEALHVDNITIFECPVTGDVGPMPGNHP